MRVCTRKLAQWPSSKADCVRVLPAICSFKWRRPQDCHKLRGKRNLGTVFRWPKPYRCVSWGQTFCGPELHAQAAWAVWFWGHALSAKDCDSLNDSKCIGAVYILWNHCETPVKQLWLVNSKIGVHRIPVSGTTWRQFCTVSTAWTAAVARVVVVTCWFPIGVLGLDVWVGWTLLCMFVGYGGYFQYQIPVLDLYLNIYLWNIRF